MKHFFTIALTLLLSATIANAQHFVADVEVTPGPTLIFKIKTIGGNISSRMADIEFFIRWSDIYGNAVTFTTPVVNTTDFPGLTIGRLDNDIDDPNYYNAHFWFGGSNTGFKTYLDNTTYEVFRVTLGGTVPLSVELVADNFSATYYYFTVQGTPGDFPAVPLGDFTPYAPDSPFISETSVVGSFYYKTIGGGTLPITLKSFTGKVANCMASLDWVTSSETNSKNFEVQQSADGVSFATAIVVPASNNGTVDNYYSQVLPLASPVNYYRLKMISTDDVPKYSKTVSLPSGNCQIVKPEVQVFPNPVVNHTINLTISGYAKETVKISVEDMGGKLIKSYDRLLNGGQNKLSLSLPPVTGGMYLLKISSKNNGIFSKKIFVE